MEIQPLRDLLLIKLDEREETSDSGIFVKKAWEDAIASATVVEAGPEAKIKKDKHIQINPYAYMDISGSDLKFIKEGDVLGYVG